MELIRIFERRKSALCLKLKRYFNHPGPVPIGDCRFARSLRPGGPSGRKGLDLAESWTVERMFNPIIKDVIVSRNHFVPNMQIPLSFAIALCLGGLLIFAEAFGEVSELQFIETRVDHEVSEIMYQQKLLTLRWQNEDSEKVLRVVFIPEQLADLSVKEILLQDSDGAVKAWNQGEKTALAKHLNDLVARKAGVESEVTVTPEEQGNLPFVISAIRRLLLTPVSKNPEKSSSIPLCEKINSWNYGSYDSGIWGVATSVLVKVGDERTQCYGRCGSQCGNAEKLEQMYGDSCLAHDLCHRIEGGQFGGCTDEFAWAADHSSTRFLGEMITSSFGLLGFIDYCPVPVN